MKLLAFSAFQQQCMCSAKGSMRASDAALQEYRSNVHCPCKLKHTQGSRIAFISNSVPRASIIMTTASCDGSSGRTNPAARSWMMFA